MVGYAMASKGPEWLIWIVTGACNLRCPYCYAERYQVEKPLSTREALSLLDEAAELGIEHVNLTGGEPLLRRDIFKIIEAARNHGIETSIFTNMTLMTEDTAAWLARLEAFLYTSLDGPRDVYEKAKGPGSWARLLKGLEVVRRHGLGFHINIPVSRLNYSRVAEAIRTAVELGASSISMIPAMPAGRAPGTGTSVSSHEFLEALRQAEAAASQLGITVAVWCAPFTRVLPWARHLTSSNCRDWNVIDITPSGKVVFCDVLGVVVADVKRDGLRGAWEKLQKHPLNRLINTTPRQCMGCPAAASCRGACYARAQLYWGQLPSPDPLCPVAGPRAPGVETGGAQRGAR